jgi:hypothetical protein
MRKLRRFWPVAAAVYFGPVSGAVSTWWFCKVSGRVFDCDARLVGASCGAIVWGIVAIVLLISIVDRGETT